MAKPGDVVEKGQPLFFIEAADMIQAQNDFLAGLAAINRAKSRVTITEIIEKQNRTLYEAKAGALRDFQTATADLAQARADLRTAESALEAARNRLAILGKTPAEITAFQEQGKISSETPIYAPLSGTVVQRKIGPGQYVSYTSTGAVDRSSPSAICRPYGSSPMSARAKRRRFAPDNSSTLRCSPIPRRRSRRTSITSPPRSMRTSAA
jgi:cobalt-zinc-cadmium efflux system membrane fusion protein